MTMKKPTSREFVERLDRIDAECPLDADDVKETLEAAGLDAAQLVADALSLVSKVESEQRSSRLAAAATKRKKELLSLSSRARATLSDAALLERLQQLQSRPGGEQLHFKNLKSCSREELETLLDDFSYLEEEDES